MRLMETLAYPAWMRHRLFWALPLALALFPFGLEFRAEGDEGALRFRLSEARKREAQPNLVEELIVVFSGFKGVLA